MTALHVDTNYRRHGLGTLVLKAMMKKLADLDMYTFAVVALNNVVSIRMFDKIGCNGVDDYSYILGTNPLIEGDWIDLNIVS